MFKWPNKLPWVKVCSYSYYMYFFSICVTSWMEWGHSMKQYCRSRLFQGNVYTKRYLHLSVTTLKLLLVEVNTLDWFKVYISWSALQEKWLICPNYNTQILKVGTLRNIMPYIRWLPSQGVSRNIPLCFIMFDRMNIQCYKFAFHNNIANKANQGKWENLKEVSFKCHPWN